MTNEDKAEQIADKNYNEYTIFGGQYQIVKDECKKSALEMAEYKDNLLKKRLDFEIEKANTYYDNKLSPYRLANHIGAITAITEILGIPFPYDRLHMGFATMDENIQ